MLELLLRCKGARAYLLSDEAKSISWASTSMSSVLEPCTEMMSDMSVRGSKNAIEGWWKSLS